MMRNIILLRRGKMARTKILQVKGARLLVTYSVHTINKVRLARMATNKN